MYSLRYNMLMLVAIFFAWAFGLLIGIFLGAPALQQQEQQLLHQVHQRYTRVLHEARLESKDFQDLLQEIDQQAKTIRQDMISFYKPHLEGHTLFITPAVSEEQQQALKEIGINPVMLSWSELALGSNNQGYLILPDSAGISQFHDLQRFTGRSPGLTPIVMTFPTTVPEWIRWVHELYSQFHHAEEGEEPNGESSRFSDHTSL